MSVRANPKAIGAFLIGALVILVAGAAVLAGATWFKPRSTFVSFFDESINGLEVGAPVKFQGVPVGNVTALLIQINRRDKTFQVPVKYEIDLTKLDTQLGTYVNLMDSTMRAQQIADGLRVTLQMESIVTGQLYLELAYKPDAKPPKLMEERYRTRWPELPTSPSLMAALGTGAGSIVGDVVKALNTVNKLLAEIDMPRINSAVVSSAKSVERLVSAPELRTTVAQLPEVTAQLQRTMAAVEKLASTADSSLGPIAVQAERATTELAAALQSLRKTLDASQGMLSTDSGIGFEIQSALVSLRDAADALQLLSATLEKNPDALLRGKRPPETKP